MNGPEIVNTLRAHRSDFEQVVNDLYALFTPWDEGEPFVSSEHLDVDVVQSVPDAGELNAGEVRLGEGTGPNSRDEIFFSADGSAVSRVEADSVVE